LQTLATYSQVQKPRENSFSNHDRRKIREINYFYALGLPKKTPDVFEAWYTGYNYKGFEISVFKNSYRDLTFGFSHKRVWRFTDKFFANYGVGIL
tara:strand:- start:4718 stop:5002 length:285 start_codon:yes stop_codon:yes gene_type:complete